MSPSAEGSATVFKLWIDEGHGGYDGGAEANGIRESLWNLQLGNATEADALKQGWEVKSTRDDDTFVSLTDRYARANAWGANAFVSIHHNAGGGSGAEVISDADHDQEASKALAWAIYDQIDDVTPAPIDRGIYADRRGLAVLRGTDMVSVIVEAEFIDNLIDAANLKDTNYFTTMASAIVRGIATWLNTPYVVSVPSTPAAPVTEDPTPILRIGSKGEAVYTLQALLNKVNGAGLLLDGDFGPKTEAAVKAFQLKYKVTGGDDGVVGEYTWGALLNPPVVAVAVSHPSLEKGSDQVEEVKLLQSILVSKGFYLGTSGPDGNGVDGVFGKLTDTAVRAYQKKFKVKGGSDGIVGDHTWASLLG